MVGVGPIGGDVGIGVVVVGVTIGAKTVLIVWRGALPITAFPVSGP